MIIFLDRGNHQLYYRRNHTWFAFLSITNELNKKYIYILKKYLVFAQIRDLNFTHETSLVGRFQGFRQCFPRHSSRLDTQKASPGALESWQLVDEVLKKNREKIFFVMEKIDFENFVSDFFENIAKYYWFSIGNHRNSYWKSIGIWYILEKIWYKIFKINILKYKKYISTIFC